MRGSKDGGRAFRGGLRTLEGKFRPYSACPARKRSPVAEKRARVEALRARAEEERTRHDKSVGVTRTMTLNNLQMGLPHEDDDA